MEMKLDVVNMKKDLGIMFDKRLEFDDHIQEKNKKANSMYDMLRRTFKHLDKKLSYHCIKSWLEVNWTTAV